MQDREEKPDDTARHPGAEPDQGREGTPTDATDDGQPDPPAGGSDSTGSGTLAGDVTTGDEP